MEKIRIACANRGAGTAPVYSTLEGGYFQEHGLDPELLFFSGHSKSLPALVAGEADFTNAVSPELICIDVLDHGDAVIVASAISRSAQQVAARPGLVTREQLRGKRWGVLTRGDADECSIVMGLERWGWDVDRDVEIVAVGADGSRLDLLLDEGRVDVAIMHAPEPFQALKRGWNIVADFAQLDAAFQNSCAATTRRFLAKRPDIVHRYARAYCQGVHRFRTDTEFGIEVIKKYSGETDRSVLEPTYVLFARLMGGMMYPSLEGVRNAAHLLHRLGVIPNLPAPEDFVDLNPILKLERENFFAAMMGIAH